MSEVMARDLSDQSFIVSSVILFVGVCEDEMMSRYLKSGRGQILGNVELETEQF